MKYLKLLGHLLLILILTLITQVCGVIWVLALILKKKYQFKKRFSLPLIYIVFNLLLVPSVAKIFGRVPYLLILKKLNASIGFIL